MTHYAAINAWNIPRDKDHPPDAVQCDACGGHGRGWTHSDSAVDKLAELACSVCGCKGWLPRGHKGGRLCANVDCPKPLTPAHVAVYCSTECALDDA